MSLERNNRTFWAESRIQEQIVSLLRRALPPHYRVLSIPNGRFAADPKTIGRLKREGLHPGAPDLIVMSNDGWFATLEIKSETGRLGESQVEFSDWLSSGGASAAVVRSLPEALEALSAWGVPLRAKVAA